MSEELKAALQYARTGFDKSIVKKVRKKIRDDTKSIDSLMTPERVDKAADAYAAQNDYCSAWQNINALSDTVDKKFQEMSVDNKNWLTKKINKLPQSNTYLNLWNTIYAPSLFQDIICLRDCAAIARESEKAMRAYINEKQS